MAAKEKTKLVPTNHTPPRFSNDESKCLSDFRSNCFTASFFAVSIGVLSSWSGHRASAPFFSSNAMQSVSYMQHVTKSRDVQNSGFRLFGRIRIVLWTIRSNKNTNSIGSWAFWRCTCCSDIYHLLKKGNEVDLYSAYHPYDSTTECSDVDHTELPANTPHLPFLRIRIR